MGCYSFVAPATKGERRKFLAKVRAFTCHEGLGLSFANSQHFPAELVVELRFVVWYRLLLQKI